MEDAAIGLVDCGANALVLGCTEFSVMPRAGRRAGVPVVDSLQVLVDATVDAVKATKSTRLGHAITLH